MEAKSNFVSCEPRSGFLEPYIDYYYFHYCEETGPTERYIFYPNFKNALTIYRNSSVSFKPGYSITFPDPDRQYRFMYSALYKHIHTVEIRPPFNRIGIVFKPLGINHFLPNPLSDHMLSYVNLDFDYFQRSMGPLTDLIFEAVSPEEKVRLLDRFFTSQFIGFDELRLKEAIKRMVSNERKLTVQELSDDLKISRKTLLRLFRDHMCCTVKDYISTVQFRRALNQYQLSDEKPSLTSLAYETDYYDQSDFINHFKKLTGYNPGKVFKKISQVGSRDTYWTFK